MNKLYSGICWKHQPTIQTENNNKQQLIKKDLVFIDYNKMIEHLKKDGRVWNMIEMNVTNLLLSFEFGNDWKAKLIIIKNLHLYIVYNALSL